MINAGLFVTPSCTFLLVCSQLDKILAAEGKNVDVAVNMAIDDTLLVDRISGR
jgi:hypothetical protein